MKTFRELQADEFICLSMYNSIIPIFIYILYKLIKQKFRK